MNYLRKQAKLLIVFLFFFQTNQAQVMQGSWEGFMGDEYLQVNITQQKNMLCGYTYDYELLNKNSFCKAYFSGYYDKMADLWVLIGQSFISNSGSHVLIQLKLWHERSDGKNTLRGLVTMKSSANSFFGLGSGDPVRLTRRAVRPNKLPNNEPTCFPEPVKRTPPTVIKPGTKPIVKAPVPRAQVIKPSPDIKDNPVQAIPLPGKDTVLNKSIPIIVKKEPLPLDQKVTRRKNKEISRLIVNTKKITLKVYDNGVVDNDTVSIYYNGRLLANKQGLTEKPLVLNIELDDDVPLHRITMFAENLGSISPNTALIVVTAGAKRYELHSSASLEENAVMLFEYKPD